MRRAAPPNDPLARAGRAIRSFTESPVTNLVKGLLLLIGLSGASHTLKEDIETWHLRVGRGLVVIGLFGVFDSVPHPIEEREASRRYADYRKSRRPPPPGSGAGPGVTEAGGDSAGLRPPD